MDHKPQLNKIQHFSPDTNQSGSWNFVMNVSERHLLCWIDLCEITEVNEVFD